MYWIKYSNILNYNIHKLPFSCYQLISEHSGKTAWLRYSRLQNDGALYFFSGPPYRIALFSPNFSGKITHLIFLRFDLCNIARSSQQELSTCYYYAPGIGGPFSSFLPAKLLRYCPVPVFRWGTILFGIILRVGWTNLYQILGAHRPITHYMNFIASSFCNCSS